MSDRPDAAELLAVAREELMKRLLPALPGALRYEALMVANAMAIAAREAAAGAGAAAREAEGLRQLTGDASLPSGRRKLCEAIRRGDFDTAGPGRQALLRYLLDTTEGKLAISNPKALAPKPAA